MRATQNRTKLETINRTFCRHGGGGGQRGRDMGAVRGEEGSPDFLTQLHRLAHRMSLLLFLRSKLVMAKIF